VTDWRAHKLWIALLALAIMIGLGNAPVLGLAQRKAEQKLAFLQDENDKTAKALHQLQQDIADAAKMKTEIDAGETEKFLAPVDRLRVAQILEHRATESHLTNFSYILSPEEKTQVETAGSGKQDLATSKITLAADAPTDIDTYAFLDAISRTLPGHFTLRQMSLHRIGAADTALSEANLHLTANGEWLSNGASRDLAEGK
jgi:hypothetical protein